MYVKARRRNFPYLFVAAASAGVTFAVVSASMTFTMSVVAAGCIRIEVQISCQQMLHLFVCIAACSRIQLNANCCQSISCTAADAAADEGFHTQFF